MEEKIICCCGARVWTRVIGWIHLIIWTFVTVACILSIIFPAYVIEELLGGEYDKDRDQFGAWTALIVSPKNKNGSLSLETTPPAQVEGTSSDLTADIVGTVCISVLCVMNFAMSIVLLFGSYFKNTYCLELWFVHSSMSYLGLLTVFLVRFAKGTSATWFVGLANFPIQLFCLWVVATHKREIEVATGRKSSIPSDAQF